MASPTNSHQSRSAAGPHKRWFVLAGISLFVVLRFVPAPPDMPAAAWQVGTVALLMAFWWLTEAIPIAVTALLPLLLLPLLRVATMADVAAPYANPLIFLFLGGFLVALAMERWDLHRRVALTLLSRVGTKPAQVLGAFMAVTAILSMWISNTATATMMLPIALAVVARIETSGAEDDAFPTALLLGVAYGATIGGLGTLIGTPPVALLAAFMDERYDQQIGFAQWMLVGVPLSAVLLAATWFVLSKIAFRLPREPVLGRQALRDEWLTLGPASAAQIRVAVVFAATGMMWLTRPFLADILQLPLLTDAGIAIAAGIALFIIPAGSQRSEFLMDWETARRLPWGVLFLFGGGLSLATAIANSGLAGWIGGALAGVANWHIILLVAVVAVVIVFLTELTSNTATTAAFLPVAAALAIAANESPLLLAVPAALAASAAFMMPVATPPNAIIFGSGRVTIPQMARTGLWLNLVSIGVITIATFTIAAIVFGIEVGTLPPWAN